MLQYMCVYIYIHICIMYIMHVWCMHHIYMSIWCMFHIWYLMCIMCVGDVSCVYDTYCVYTYCVYHVYVWVNTWFDAQWPLDFGLLLREALEGLVWLLTCIPCKVHHCSWLVELQDVKMGWNFDNLFWRGGWSIEKTNHCSRLGSSRTWMRPQSSEFHSLCSFSKAHTAFPPLPVLPT